VTSTETPTLTSPASAVTRCEHCGDDVTDGGSFCSDEHAAAWLESPFL
jgi:hypothetical protein